MRNTVRVTLGSCWCATQNGQEAFPLSFILGHATLTSHFICKYKIPKGCPDKYAW